MPSRPKTQKEQLAEHGAMLEQLAAAMASLAESQKQLAERLAQQPGAPPQEEERRREADVLAKCPRVSVWHSGEKRVTFTWNASHQFTFQPGANENVPEIFAKMYADWVATKKDGEERARRLGERKSYEEQERLLSETRTPMR